MKISFVVAARNDDHGEGFIARLQRSVDNLFVLVAKTALDTELILVEWNNPPKAVGLRDALDWGGATIPIRIIRVPPELHATIPQADKFNIFVCWAENVGIRRAQGEFVLISTSDILYSEDMIACLAKDLFDENCFYNAVRHDIDDTGRVVQIREHEPIHGALHTNACGDFTMIARSRWEELRGYPEVPFNTYVDGTVLYMAEKLGMQQVILPHPIFHMNHGIAERDSRPVLDRTKAPPEQFDNWGFHDIKLEEITILGGKMKKFPEVPEINLSAKGTLNSFHHTDKWIQTLLMAMSAHFGLRTFVETGTQAGNTIAAVHKDFDAVYSLEIFEAFYTRAQARFADTPNVHLILGSSGNILADVLQKEGITKALFWLDAHGEGKATAEGDQLYRELRAIEQYAPDSLVVIDDVIRGSGGYEVNFTYPFTTPEGWKELYIHPMSLLVLHRDGYSMPEGLQL